MKLNSIRHKGVWAVALVLCIALASAPAVHAQDQMTAQSLIDRQLILDQITRYYYNFGRETKIPESSFYAEDGALIARTTAIATFIPAKRKRDSAKPDSKIPLERAMMIPLVVSRSRYRRRFGLCVHPA